MHLLYKFSTVKNPNSVANLTEKFFNVPSVMTFSIYIPPFFRDRSILTDLSPLVILSTVIATIKAGVQNMKTYIAYRALGWYHRCWLKQIKILEA